MEFILTTRGSCQVVHNGYLYQKNKTLASGLTYWECTWRRSGDGCKGRIVIVPDDTFLRKAEKIEIVPSRAGMKRTAQNTTERTQNILTTNIQGWQQETLAQMPNSKTLKWDIQRQRRPDNPPVPDANNTQFALRQPYTVISTGERFLFYDNQRHDMILLFGTQRSIDHLGECRHWFMDRTFKTSPGQFIQVYMALMKARI